MVNRKTLLAARDEAERFIRAVDAAAARLSRDGNDLGTITGTAETGAVKRASMDLTRALAELRRARP
jgi:hypothetical protein